MLGFLAVILVGAFLLMLPISSAKGNTTGFTDALFTSASATCVTGLTVFETGSYWSVFGKLVIIMLIQIGGLGFITIAFLFSIIAKRKITPKERILFAQSMNLTDLGGIVRFARFIVCGTFITELTGALLLSFRFIPEYGAVKGLAYSLFHSVSAFCNAGFDILGNGDSMCAYSGDAYVCIVLSLLVIFGGLGFFVWRDLYLCVKEKQKMSAYSKVVLIMTALLLTVGTIVIYVFEKDNTVFSSMSGGEKLLASFFQSAVTRTAGFSSIDLASMSAPSKAVSMLLMFIGGASGSTAGGIKVGTFALIIIAVLATLKGNDKFTVFKRNISRDNVLRAMGVFSVGVAVVSIFGFTLCIIEPSLSFTDIFYEVISAFATVGQTLGITPLLSDVSKILVTVLMFFGRVGILTVTYSIMFRQVKRENLVTYPETSFFIG